MSGWEIKDLEIRTIGIHTSEIRTSCGPVLCTVQTVKFCAAKIAPRQNSSSGLISRGLFWILCIGKIQNSSL